MKKNRVLSFIILCGIAVFASCSKDGRMDTTDNTGVDVTGKPITISATLSDALTKVTYTPGIDGEGKPYLALTWVSTDQLRVANHDNPSEYTNFDLVSGEGEKKAVFSGTPVAATSYDVSVVHNNPDESQEQASDGSTTHLQYVATASGITDLTTINFTEVSSILGITVRLPDGATQYVKSVDITASENIFYNGKELHITLTSIGDTDGDNKLRVYATLPVGNKEIPAGTTLLFKFNTPTQDGHTVYTRWYEMPSAVTLESGKFNHIQINCPHIATHAGNKSDNGTAEHPYLIADKYQMQAINDLMVEGSTKCFKLVDDVDMSGVSWTRLNPDPFTKAINFDGNGKTISYLNAPLFQDFNGTAQNLTIDHSTIAINGELIGVFACTVKTAGASVTNVDVSNSSITSTNNNPAGLISEIDASATITNCDISNTTVSGARAGGLAYFANALVTVTNCSYSGGTITGSSNYVGGLIGSVANYASVITGCRVENATITVSRNQDIRAGGLIGILNESATVKGCTVGTSGAKVTLNTPEPADSKVLNCGGFVGVNYGTITKDDLGNRCKAYVTVTSANTKGQQLNLGGFAGYQRGTISYSDAVVSMGDLQGQYIGGFCGYIVYQAGKTVLTDNCTVIGDGDSGTVDIKGNNYTGGFVGVAESGTFIISNCQVLEGTVVVGQSTAGGFAGQIKSGTVEDCTANVDMRSRGGNAGGFVGAITGGTVQRCSSAGTLSQIESTNNVFGGFAGYVNGVDLTKCSSVVNITVGRNYVGGLVGSFQTANTVSKCFYNGTISSPANTKGGLIGTTEAVAVVITNCYTAGEMVASIGTQVYGGIVGELKAGGSVTNCYSTMDMTHGGRAMGGIVGRACSGGWPVSNESNNTVSKCIAWNPNITFDGTAGTSASSGAIVGYTSFKNILNNCYRRYDMVYKNSNTAVGTACQTSMVDQVDCDGTNWAINGNRPAGGTPAGTSADAQYQAPYYGVAASAGTTVSSLAQALGWSSDVWDFSADLPTLK